MLNASKIKNVIRASSLILSLSLGLLSIVSIFAMEERENCASKQEIKKRAHKGDAQAQYEFAILKKNAQGSIRIKQLAKAIPWLEKAALQDHSDAQYMLALMYIDKDNEGIEINIDKALELVQELIDKNDAKGQNLRGWLYENGMGVPQDDEEGLKWRLLAAEQEYPSALENLGWRYESGNGFPRDREKAIQYYQRAAAQGNSSAQFSLGHGHQNGKGLKKDKKKAIEFYELAAAQGYTLAQINLGNLYIEEKEYDKGIELLQAAALKEHPDAEYNMGVLYFYGIGVKRDKIIAREWWKKAADHGNSVAQQRLSEGNQTKNKVVKLIKCLKNLI